MKIILPPHLRPAKKVEDLNNLDFRKEIKEILAGIKDGSFYQPGSRWNDCFAVAQPQVSKDPYRYFVLNPAKEEVVKEFGGLVIINPHTISKDKLTRTMHPEGCLSYPFRPVKKTKRFNKIEVEYFVLAEGKSNEEAIKVNKTLEGMAAMVYQHEHEHLSGKSIFT